MMITSRIIAAIIGGYLLANVVAILLSYLLSGEQAIAVLTAMMVSFLIYAAAVIWVFAAKTAWLAWVGLMIPSLIGGLLVFFLSPIDLL